MRHESVGPPHLYAKRTAEDIPTVGLRPGKLLKWEIWLDDDAIMRVRREELRTIVIALFVLCVYMLHIENYFFYKYNKN
jgi:hypothetical protein